MPFIIIFLMISKVELNNRNEQQVCFTGCENQKVRNADTVLLTVAARVRYSISSPMKTFSASSRPATSKTTTDFLPSSRKGTKIIGSKCLLVWAGIKRRQLRKRHFECKKTLPDSNVCFKKILLRHIEQNQFLQSPFSGLNRSSWFELRDSRGKSSCQARELGGFAEAWFGEGVERNWPYKTNNKHLLLFVFIFTLDFRHTKSNYRKPFRCVKCIGKKNNKRMHS